MKILFFLNSKKFFISHFQHVAIDLIKNGQIVYLLAPNDCDEEVAKGVVHVDLELSRSSINLFFEFKLLLDIYKKIEQISPDLLHCFTIKPVLYSNLMHFFFPKKISIVSTITGMGSLYLSKNIIYVAIRFLINFIYKFIFKLSGSLLVFENVDDKNYFLEKNYVAERSTKVINGAGVDIKLFKFVERDFYSERIIITFIGRLLIDKGIVEFLKSAKESYDSNLPLTFQVVGDYDFDNPSAISKAQVEEYKKLPNITFLGFRNDVQNIYSNSHIACLPSYREGLPKSLIEAAASGLPIITTNVVGCRQMVPSEKYGFLVKPKSVNSLFESYSKVLENRSLLFDISKNNRKRAEKEFSQSFISEEYRLIYKDYLNI